MKPIPPHGRRTLTLPITENRSVEERTGRPGAGTGRTRSDPPRGRCPVPTRPVGERRARGAGRRQSCGTRHAARCPPPMAPPTQGETGGGRTGPLSLRPGPAEPPDEPVGAIQELRPSREQWGWSGCLVVEREEEAGGLRGTFPGVYRHARVGAKAAGMRLSLFIQLCPRGN